MRTAQLAQEESPVAVLVQVRLREVLAERIQAQQWVLVLRERRMYLERPQAQVWERVLVLGLPEQLVPQALSVV